MKKFMKTALLGGCIGSNPYSKCLFSTHSIFSSLKFDFLKSEENGEKTRKSSVFRDTSFLVARLDTPLGIRTRVCANKIDYIMYSTRKPL